MKSYQELSLPDFQKKYQTEEDCEKRLFELRWPKDLFALLWKTIVLFCT